MLLFAVLIGAVLFAFNRAGTGVGELSELYDQQARLEQFKSSLPNVLLPLNDYTLTRNPEDVTKLEVASQEFLRLYGEVAALPVLTDADNKELQEVFELMQEVIGIADDIVSGKIPEAMAGNVTIVAQSLVSVGQEKMGTVTDRLKGALSQATNDKTSQIEQLALINIGIIVLVVIILAVTSRGFVTRVSASISAVAGEVSDSSVEIIGAVEQQANASDTQARSVAGVTAELGDMSEQAKKIALTATSVERIAMATSQSADEGAKAVKEAIGYMDKIRQEVTIIAEKVADAGRKAEQILDSVSSIQEIADETHLLALNASIESAAAGEFGKRFAVVAGEVRRLSERARAFTDEIQTVVNDVHISTRESIEVTQEGLAEVAQGLEIAQRASEALEKMQSMSKKTSQAVRTIAQATGRQDESSQEFVLTMRQISDLLQDQATQMQKSRVTSQRLNETAETLKNLV
ncbi:MAG: methyl-accepting chemotaxis protein [Mariprofundaceae bacterium]|nr:methyl-accepting chemotaxis protein [Mariprofundaceae bacterium]